MTMNKKKNYWVSWWHRESFGAFEIESPWWISGEDGASTEKSICCAIKAKNETEARKKIIDSYDEPLVYPEFRFCTEKPDGWSPFSSRFQRADWMKWNNGGASER